MSVHPSAWGDRCDHYCTESLYSVQHHVLIHPVAPPLPLRKISACFPPLQPADLALSRQAAVVPVAHSSWIWLTGLSENEADKQCNPRHRYIIPHPFTLSHLSSISRRSLSNILARLMIWAIEVPAWTHQVWLMDCRLIWLLITLATLVNALHAPAPCRRWWGYIWHFSPRFYCLPMTKQPDLLRICTHDALNSVNDVKVHTFCLSPIKFYVYV